MEDTPTPARSARAAMRAVESGSRERWLAAFAADARVEDPVGHAAPLVGHAALATFWDGAIAALGSARFDVGQQWEAGDEAVLIATVTVATADGATATYDGAFHYTIDADGAIVSLRAFWDLPAVAAALAGGGGS